MNIYKDYYELQTKYKNCQEAINDVLSMIVSIGAPLNDNKYKYNKEQLKYFLKYNQYLNLLKKK